ncbi:MAG: VacJ family lipoprotein [Pseudohongiellaceae bacterium]
MQRSHCLTQLRCRTPLALLLLLTAALAGGCASTDDTSYDARPVPSDTPSGQDVISGTDGIQPTVVAYDDYGDPLMGLNRVIFAFNEVSYRYAFIPLARGYTGRVPEPVQQGVGNFYYNIRSPLYLINNLLQLRPAAAGTNLLRFGINSTVGLLGFFDPARHWLDLDRADTSLNETLTQYGMGYGAYLVLPLIGSSDLRGGTATVAESFLDPTGLFFEGRERIIVQGIGNFQEVVPQLLLYTDLLEESDDPYIFMRNMYLQNMLRDAEYQDSPEGEEQDP